MGDLTNIQGVLAFSSSIAIILVIALQILKKSVPSFDNGGKKAKYLPIISVVIGLVIGALVYPFTDLNLTLRLWAGFFAGAGASGLYDLSKVTK